MIKSLTVLATIFFVAALSLSCGGQMSSPDIFPREASLGEAEKVLGVDVPEPHYLTAGYKLDRVTIINRTAVLLTFGGRDMAEIELRIQWDSLGVPAYRIDLSKPTLQLKSATAEFRETRNSNRVTWNWTPDRYPKSSFGFELTAPQTLAVSEIILIADSIGW